MYSEEDVYFGSYVDKFFDGYSLADVGKMMRQAKAFLGTWMADEAANGDADERRAAQQLMDYVELRESWLRTLTCTSVDYLMEDPSALKKSSEELGELQALHTRMQGNSNGSEDSVAVEVEGVFDKKCMRNYPTMAPIKPRPLKTLSESHAFFGSVLTELSLVQQLMDITSVESLLHLTLQFAQRTPTASPLVRSLVASLFVSENRILLRQPIIAFTERAIRECTGPYIWSVLETADGEARERVGMFVQEAARMVIDWVKTQCQNAPRQRRIAMKYLGGWDSLQGEAEQLDIWLYSVLHPQSTAASDPKRNPFWFSSWAYHMKLLLMEIGAMAGMRLDVYLEHEFNQIFCYATQIFEAHHAHLSRMQAMLESASPTAADQGTKQGAAVPAALWTMRGVPKSECLAQLTRWRLLVLAQKDLATATWLVTHACERLGVFTAPWAQKRNILALTACKQQETPEAQAARYALRFRVFQRLNSPTPLTFDGWQATTHQLDDYRICDLFTHAANILAATKTALEAGRKQAVRCELWETSYRALFFVVLSNALALARLAGDPAMKSLAATTTGHDALAFRQLLLDAEIAALSATTDGCENQDNQDKPKSKSKAKAKRDRQKKRKAAKAESTSLASAREWKASVDALTQPGIALDIKCRCMPDKHPDWPKTDHVDLVLDCVEDLASTVVAHDLRELCA
ncbi:N-alpha-acetyltransferase, non-catalitic subunit [Linderina macrospora]|uniref:N-alpha-acetyltransferase, non-catalitic subunit n=1 Tax=Linderina macrospora TaxID=4868 RepID=A0ACC1JCQ4_9FUNG|nr:N-alpha-acetyltransferase, non-catalitic subunit [Linderina macrospora]